MPSHVPFRADENAETSSDSASLNVAPLDSADISLGDAYELSAMGDLSLSEGFVLAPDEAPSPRKPPRKPRQPSLRMKIARPARPSMKPSMEHPQSGMEQPSEQKEGQREYREKNRASGQTETEKGGERKRKERTTPDFRALVESLRGAGVAPKQGGEGRDTRAALQELLHRA